MYLIGDLGNRFLYDMTVHFKEQATKEDLIRAKKDPGYQVINVTEMKYFDPVQNKWVDIKTK